MLLYSSWTRLPLQTRHKIASQFGISKTSPTHVSDNRIVQDGFKVEDIENALNVRAMQEFVGVEHTDMQTLFELVIAKLENPEVEVTKEPEVIEEKKAPEVVEEEIKKELKSEPIEDKPKKKPGRKSKAA